MACAVAYKSLGVVRDLDGAVRGKEREIPNAVSARHEDALSWQRLSLLKTTLQSSGCSPFVQATTRLCSGTLHFINTMARLCAACRKTPLAGGHHLEFVNTPHHRTASQLRAAAEEGCQMCALLWGTFSARERSELLGMQPAKAKRESSRVCCNFLSYGKAGFGLEFHFRDGEYYITTRRFVFDCTEGL